MKSSNKISLNSLFTDFSRVIRERRNDCNGVFSHIYHKNFMLGEKNESDKVSTMGRSRGGTSDIDQQSMASLSQKKRNNSASKGPRTTNGDTASYAGSTRNKQSEFGSSSRRPEGQERSANLNYRTAVIVRMDPEGSADEDTSLSNVRVLDTQIFGNYFADSAKNQGYLKRFSHV